MKGHARHLMALHVVSVEPDMPVADVGRTLVVQRVAGVPVVDAEHRVLGLVTESDVLTAMLRGEPDRPAREVMSHPAIVVDEFATTAEVLSTLRDAKIHHLPVVRLGRLVGIITTRDVLRYVVDKEMPIPQEDA